MSKHLATVARKNFLLTGRNLGTEPGSNVGGHLTRPVGLRERRDKQGESGGKGSNQAIAAKRCNADILLMTKIGEDVLSEVALSTYKKENFDMSFILKDKNYDTGIALINVDKNTSQNSITVYPGACLHFNDDDIKLLSKEIEKCDIFLSQLEINIDAVQKCIDIAYKNNKTIVLNTAPIVPIATESLAKCTVITPNEIEASLLTGVEVSDMESARKSSHVFFDMGIKNVIITLGKKGSYVNDKKTESFIEPIEVKTVDTTGAGDAFTGGLVTALSEGSDLQQSVKFATAVASLSTTKYGTAPAMPYRASVDELIKIHYN